MGQLIAFKRCRWSETGFCIATSVLACVCHRGGSSKMLTALGRPPRLVSFQSDYAIPIHEVSAKECPPPWSAPQAGMGELDLDPDDAGGC